MKTARKIVLQPSHIRVYRFVEKYIGKNITSPHVHEIAAGIKLTHRQSYRLVEDLCELGYFSKMPYIKRSIVITKPLQ